jgi:hypothetical protein
MHGWREEVSMLSSSLWLLLLGCPPDGDTDEPSEESVEYDCELGTVDDETGVYSPLASDQELELVLGFQGFLFVSLWVRQQDEAAPVCMVNAAVTPDDMGPMPTQQPIDFVHDGTGYISREVVLFLESATPSLYEGDSAQIDVRVTEPGRHCLASATVKLVDNDACIHSDEDPICPGDSGYVE